MEILVLIFFTLNMAFAEPRNPWLEKTVDQMTCAEARQYVEKHGRYWISTPDGPIPIYPVKRLRGPHYPYGCTGRKKNPAPHIRPTKDNPRCLMGWSCIP